ncbi:hypothetical protein P20439_3520 [Pseudoalteromonas sp. BSi20439]|nr:hypothetical protein P20439_3520 [Pseudoalteromonas sp. BSi20439]
MLLVTHSKWLAKRLLCATELPTLPVYFIGYRLTLITIFFAYYLTVNFTS